jgi:hypothetical protein
VSTIALVQDLFRHMEWADACIWKSVFESPAGHSDLTIRTRLYHLHMVHWTFLHVWLDEPLPQIPDQIGSPTAEWASRIGGAQS